MGVTANWYVESVPVDDEYDPFAASEIALADAATARKPVDINHGVAVLEERLQDLIHREGNLDSCGITCSLKDRADTVCSVCPVSQHLSKEAPLGVLCRVGREQERVVTQLAVLRFS